MIIFFEPVFKEAIWGGKRLEEFGYNLSSDKTGECWGISAHPNGQSTVKNGLYKGMELGELWDKNRELFGGLKGDKFPLLIKIIDANDDLSVQVHPDDKYAKKNENGEFGKSECWYILDVKDDGDMIYGIKAKTREELNHMIDEGRWEDLLRTVNIQKGDFFYIPSGTVHAIKSGTLIYEIQQNSDTTYRLYDYDRRDKNGKLRELHIEKSKDVIEVPFNDERINPKIEKNKNLKITKFLKTEFFTVDKFEIKGKASLTNDYPFLLMSVIEGSGQIGENGESFPLKKGDHFIISSKTKDYNIEGKLEIIVSYL